MLCETRFLYFFALLYGAAATLILHFDWYYTGNYVSFCIIQLTLTACVCVCVCIRVIYILLCKYDWRNINYE